MFSRNAGVARGEGAPALVHDWSADQPEGAASVQPRPAEEEGRLAAGEAAAADGAGPPAAGAGQVPASHKLFATLPSSGFTFDLPKGEPINDKSYRQTAWWEGL